MRIAIVNLVSQTPPGRWALPRVESNRQSVGVQFARALEQQGHDVVVYMADGYRPEVSDEGVRCVYVKTRLARPFSPALIPFTPELRGLIARGGFDIVVCSELFQWAAVLCALAQREGRFRLYIWQEMGAHQKMGAGLISGAYHATVGRYVIARTQMFLPRAEPSGRFLESVGVPKRKIGPVVPNGADAACFNPGSEHARDDDPLILCVGSLVALKQPELVVKMLPLVLATEPRARLLVKGSGPLEPMLRAMAREMGVEAAVEFDCGRSDHAQMADLYRRAWVGVFPTNGEGASLSPVEMVMCGTPVVVAEKLYHSSVLEEFGGAEVTGFALDDLAAATLRQISRVRSGDWNPVRQSAAMSARYSTQSMALSLAALDEQQRGGR